MENQDLLRLIDLVSLYTEKGWSFYFLDPRDKVLTATHLIHESEEIGSLEDFEQFIAKYDIDLEHQDSIE